MSQLYPDPPHLSIAAYSERPETETFAGMCDVVQDLGCTPVDLVEVAPRDLEFELLSDLGAAKKVQAVSPARRAELVAGQDPGLRAVKAAYSHSEYGTVIVDYVLRTGSGRHPVEVSLSAHSLGFPEDLWSDSDRRSAEEIDDWSVAVLAAAVSKCDILYGAIGVEFSLSTPQQLANGEHDLAIDLFVSRRLLDRDKSLEGKLGLAFTGGHIATWDTGLFYSGWAPFVSRRYTVKDTGFTVRSAASALGSAFAENT